MTDFATYCPECGTGDPGEEFCASCGERLLAVVVSVFRNEPKRAISAEKQGYDRKGLAE